MTGTDTPPEKLTKVAAMRALLAWADSDGTAQALQAMELLALDDADVEALFRVRAGGRVVRIPHLGGVT